MNQIDARCVVTPEFKPGDHVTLKSGGPDMEVVDIGKHWSEAWCRWRNNDGEAAYGSFVQATLTPLAQHPCIINASDAAPLTEQEMFCGLFNLVAALAERLTGHKVKVRIDSFKGGWFTCEPATRHVTWEPQGAAASSRDALAE